MSEAAMQGVLTLSAPERYQYLVHRAAEWGEAWGLRTEEGWVVVEIDGMDCFCLWPSDDFARSCAVEEWDECIPERISLQELLDELLPALQEDNLRLAVFPTPGTETALVDARDFRDHLVAHLPGAGSGETGTEPEAHG